MYAAGTVVKVKGGKRQGVISHDAAEAVAKAGGELSRVVALTSRVRYFARAGVLGGQDFVEHVFALKHDYFPASRKDGARQMWGGIWGELRNLRRITIKN